MKDEDDDLRELNELLQQYAEAKTEERKHLWPGVERAISNVSPSLLDTADTRFFNGDYLKDMFDQCTKLALARPDLSPDRKTNAREDADDFAAFFNAAKQWQVPRLAAHAFEMATLALFTGLRAGLNQQEAENFIKEAKAEFVRRATEARGQKDDLGRIARHAAIGTICAEKGWSLDERGIPEALATVIESDPRYKDETGKPLFSASRRTIADDLISLAMTTSSPDKR